jgi:hypothetical protein
MYASKGQACQMKQVGSTGRVPPWSITSPIAHRWEGIPLPSALLLIIPIKEHKTMHTEANIKDAYAILEINTSSKGLSR